MNTVQQNVQSNFSTISLDKKIEIKTKGRPSPDLNVVQITKSKTRDYVREFSDDDYRKHD